MKQNKSILPLLAFLLFLLSNGKLLSQETSSSDLLKSFVSSNYERLGVAAADAQTLLPTFDYTDPSTGIRHVYATQVLNGLSITNSSFSLHVFGQRKVEANNMVSTKQYVVKPVVNTVTSSQAIISLMDAVNYTGDRKFELKSDARGTDKVTIYKRSASSIWDIAARLVYFNNERLQVLQPAWEVQMMDQFKKHYWLGYIDAATGLLLEKRDLMLHCEFDGAATDAFTGTHAAHKHNLSEQGSQGGFKNLEKKLWDPLIIPGNTYRVYDMPLESPGDTIQQTAPHAISTRNGDLVASPDGWHKVANGVPYQYTRGNNVWAFQDPSPGPLGGVPSADPSRTAYNNSGLAGAPKPDEPFGFDYPINLNDDPSVYMKGAIVNLFYWNNIIHDVFYNLGFTEAAGNFEDSHVFSTGTKAGGMQADAVLAQAQDGGGTNNANFLTTPDGTPGQMQMYLWTAAFPDSLVQIATSSTGIPPANKKYIAVQGSFNATPGTNTNLFTNPVLNKQFVMVKKNQASTVGTDEEGCSTGQQSIALPPGNDVSNKIVVIYRGSCSFAEKVLGAQAGGAAGVIVINNVDGPPLAMGGADAPGNAISIPAVMISKADGDPIAAQLRAGANIVGSLKRDAPPSPKRDGDVDNGVIAHEYGHGISNRLTAPNTVGPLGGSEQGGEGWSDYIGLYMTLRSNDLMAANGAHPNGVLPTRSIGNYVTYQKADGRGIRPTPYSIDKTVNPSTFKDIGKGGEITVPHGVGYIWCTMMYEMLQLFIDQYGFNNNVYEGAVPVSGNPPAAAKGNNIAMRLILEGIKLQGTSPTFVRQRDAILKADSLLYGGQHACKIWTAFASRGLGFSAKSNTNGVGDEFEAYDLPLTCNPNQKRVNIVKTGAGKLNNPGPVSYTVTVTNKYATPLTGVLVTDTLPSGLSLVSASDGGILESGVVKWTIDLAGNAAKTFTLSTQLNLPSSSTERFSDDHEAGIAKWTAENTGGLTNWTYTTNAAEAYSGTKYWFAPNTGTPPGTNTNLRTTNATSVPANGELVFIHKYSTERRYDGGVVEISENGVTWTYLPPAKFLRGGYNDVIPNTNNPAIGSASLAAFTGTSPGYIVSIAKLDDYANKNIFIRFRFTCDQTGGTVAGGGWWMDDVYVLVNRTEIVNRANAFTTPGEPLVDIEGTNARNSSSAFVLGSGALPSSLGTLTGVANKTSVDLKWQTFNELNVSMFEVERKARGEVNFMRVGSVSPAGNSTQSRSYLFNDAGVTAGNQYQYRIKQVNRSGEFYYTNIAVVNLGGKVFKADIYPNPANTVANLTIVNPEGGKITIKLFDVLGKRIATFDGGRAISQVLSLPVRGLQNGTYWVEVNTEEQHTTLRLVVNK